MGTALHLAFALCLTIFKSFGGIAEAWKQVLVQVQLLVCDIIAACCPALFEELMALDTAALLVQILGVTG